MIHKFGHIQPSSPSQVIKTNPFIVISFVSTTIACAFSKIAGTIYIMGTLGTSDWCTCSQVSQIIGVLQVPVRTFKYLR